MKHMTSVDLNRRQRFVLKCCASVLSGMLLFPPFVIDFASGTAGQGFAFILYPPDDRATVAVVQLFIQWLFVITVSALCFALAGSEPD